MVIWFVAALFDEFAFLRLSANIFSILIIGFGFGLRRGVVIGVGDWRRKSAEDAHIPM